MKKALGHVDWRTVNESRYSSIDQGGHEKRMGEARVCAERCATENLHLYAAFGAKELSAMCEQMAYYIVQVEAHYEATLEGE